MDTIKKNTQTLSDASKEVGLDVNVEKTKYMLLSLHQIIEWEFQEVMPAEYQLVRSTWAFKGDSFLFFVCN
jgi:hypothetical protein